MLLYIPFCPFVYLSNICLYTCHYLAPKDSLSLLAKYIYIYIYYFFFSLPPFSLFNRFNVFPSQMLHFLQNKIHARQLVSWLLWCITEWIKHFIWVPIYYLYLFIINIIYIYIIYIFHSSIILFQDHWDLLERKYDVN